MTDCTLASLNVRNLNGAEQKFGGFHDSLSRLRMLVHDYAGEHSDFSLTDASKRTPRRAIRGMLACGSYNDAQIGSALDMNHGERGHSRPDVAMRSRAGIMGERDADFTRDDPAVHDAEKLLGRKTPRDTFFNCAFSWVYESVGQIYLSRYFVPEAPFDVLTSNPGKIMKNFTLTGER